MKTLKILKKYPLDSVQIYFSSSLELQQELLNHGFKVPFSSDRKIKTPIPIIYSNFKGWITSREPITLERLILPEWMDLDINNLAWKEVKIDNRRAYVIPPEESYLILGYSENNRISLLLDVQQYHLERTSIRGINPEKWNNWLMFYIDISYYDELLESIKEFTENRELEKLEANVKISKEELQGKKEITYYAYLSDHTDIGMPLSYYSICLGCFDLALRYLRKKAIENSLNKDIVNELKLRLEYDHNIRTGLKVGVAKILNKNPQTMFKLASVSPKKIRGLIKNEIEGKGRGNLVHCQHINKYHYIEIEPNYLYASLKKAKEYLDKLPTNEYQKLLLKRR